MFGLGYSGFIATPKEVYSQLSKEAGTFVNEDNTLNFKKLVQRLNELDIRYSQLNNY